MTDTTPEGDARHMRRAIELARSAALDKRSGGPFGCVIVREGHVIAEGWNEVLSSGDPTAHAEMVAIRNACAALGTRDLSGCTVYTTGEPCPMCYGACWWARVDRIFFASNHDDAHEYGDFDDRPILEALRQPADRRSLPSHELCRSEMLEIWRTYAGLPDRPHY